MTDWSKDQDDALAELLDPRLNTRPLFPTFDGKQATSIAGKPLLGPPPNWLDGFTIRIPAGTWLDDFKTSGRGISYSTSTPHWLSGYSADLIIVDDITQSNAQIEFDRLVHEAEDQLVAEMISAGDLVIHPEPMWGKITRITDS